MTLCSLSVHEKQPSIRNPRTHDYKSSFGVRHMDREGLPVWARLSETASRVKKVEKQKIPCLVFATDASVHSAQPTRTNTKFELFS